MIICYALDANRLKVAEITENDTGHDTFRMHFVNPVNGVHHNITRDSVKKLMSAINYLYRKNNEPVTWYHMNGEAYA